MKIVAPDMTGVALKPYVHTKVVPPPRGSRVPEWDGSGVPPSSEQLR